MLKIQELLPQLQPTSTMSDGKEHLAMLSSIFILEREYMDVDSITCSNFETYPKFGLAPSNRNIPELAVFVRQIMAIPFLPCDLIHSTYSCLQIPKLQQIEKCKLDDFLRYYKKYWLIQIRKVQKKTC